MKWEYKIVQVDTRGFYAERLYPADNWNWRTAENGGFAQLAALGEQGWELVSVGAWTPMCTQVKL